MSAVASSWPCSGSPGPVSRSRRGRSWDCTTRHLPRSPLTPCRWLATTSSRPARRNADGFGVRSAKLEDYHSYTRDRRFHPGLKLFYENDVDLMRPREVLKLKPAPRVINYQ